MGVGKSMKIFMEGMQGFMNTGGNGGRILHTPMGPFQWNDDLQVWVNVNNGYQMANISMQDLLAIGYDPIGDTNYSSSDNNNNNFLPTCTDLITAIPTTTITGMLATQIKLFPGTTTTPTLTCSPYIYVSDEIGSATHEILFRYSVDGGSNYTSFIPLPNATSSNGRTNILFPQGGSIGGTVIFQAYKKTVSNWITPGTYSVYIRNSYDGSQIGRVNISTINPA